VICYLMWSAESLVTNCCAGTIYAGAAATSNSMTYYQCPQGLTDACYTYNSTQSTTYGCTSSSTCSLYSCCTLDNCNCPASGPSIHKDYLAMTEAAGNMRSIMFPVLGIPFAIAYLVIAIFLSGLPHGVLLTVSGLITFVLALFLLLLPGSAYFGLYFAALGALCIGATRATSKFAAMSVAVLSVLGFFILTAVVYIFSGGVLFESLIFTTSPAAVGTSYCEQSMNIVNLQGLYYNLNTRCENYLLFTLFCVYVLVLLQPINALFAFGLAK